MLTAAFRAPLEFLLLGLPQPCDAGRDELLVRSVNGAGSGGAVTPAFFSAWFGMAIGILVARKIRTGRFVDKPSDRLALGDLAARAVDGDNHRIVERLDEQRRWFFECGPRGSPYWGFLNRLCTGGLPRPTS